MQINGTEVLWLEIKFENQKPFLLAYVYRRPSSNNAWMSAFEQNLEKIYAEDRETILLGDVNIHLFDSTSSNTRNWLQVTDSVNLTHLVDVPTRVTPNSSTLIDHAFSNKPQNIVDVFVPCYAISDHFPVCLIRKIAKSNKTGETFCKRSISCGFRCTAMVSA